MIFNAFILGTRDRRRGLVNAKAMKKFKFQIEEGIASLLRANENIFYRLTSATVMMIHNA